MTTWRNPRVINAVCVLSFCSVLLAACAQSALMQMRQENTEREARIASKEGELKAQEDQRTALLREQKNLLSELDTKQMTLKELDVKLDALRRENARMQTDTETQQKKKESLELQLRKYQADIAALEKDGRLSADDKKKRIEDLKKQISAHLKLMLAL